MILGQEEEMREADREGVGGRGEESDVLLPETKF